jgi:hypothetical protein
MDPSDSQAGPPPKGRLKEAIPSPSWASRVATHSFPTCRPHYPGEAPGSSTVALPGVAAFPALMSGRPSQSHFRGLLRVHSRYGPQFRWPSFRGRCPGGSTTPVAQRPPARSYGGEPSIPPAGLPPARTRHPSRHTSELGRLTPRALRPRRRRRRAGSSYQSPGGGRRSEGRGWPCVLVILCLSFV